MVVPDGFETHHAQVSMTPDELSRFVRMEEAVKQLGKDTVRMETRVETMDGKIDQLLTAAAMGKGAWWAILKVGGVLTMIVSGAVWVWQQTGGKLG